jgi:isopentenyl-diphosphate delta-isomerase
MKGKKVVLVDEYDKAVGTMDKLRAHRRGRLHRAFSIFIFNSGGELLLQQRALGKYHSAGLWSNTCCSHPAPGEEILEAANRRLTEEMGMNCVLYWQFSFIYKEEMSNGLTEYELDHVLFGVTDTKASPNPAEALDCKYITMKMLAKELASNAKSYTKWLLICFDQVSIFSSDFLKAAK